MTDFEQYKEHIEYTFNAFCKIVIRHAAIDESRRLKSIWEHEISFEYLTEEKFYPFSTYILQSRRNARSTLSLSAVR